MGVLRSGGMGAALFGTEVPLIVELTSIAIISAFCTDRCAAEKLAIVGVKLVKVKPDERIKILQARWERSGTVVALRVAGVGNRGVTVEIMASIAYEEGIVTYRLEEILAHVCNQMLATRPSLIEESVAAVFLLIASGDERAPTGWRAPPLATGDAPIATSDEGVAELNVLLWAPLQRGVSAAIAGVTLQPLAYLAAVLRGEPLPEPAAAKPRAATAAPPLAALADAESSRKRGRATRAHASGADGGRARRRRPRPRREDARTRGQEAGHTKSSACAAASLISLVSSRLSPPPSPARPSEPSTRPTTATGNGFTATSNGFTTSRLCR
jgi:hypothetical protein